MAINYTYYGDLLGISGYYKLSSQVAFEKLNVFYNTVFHCMGTYRPKNNVSIQMFSDSLLVWGNNAEKILLKLQEIYIRLMQNGLLLRGAVVDGKLQRNPRLQLDNFERFLPQTDHLARAVGLENTQKGARLLIEPSLAEKLLKENKKWITHDGYINNFTKSVPISSVLRRVCPTPDNNSFELLYFWVCPGTLKPHEIRLFNYQTMQQDLKNISSFLTDEIAQHYKETIALLKRSKLRDEITRKKKSLTKVSI